MSSLPEMLMFLPGASGNLQFWRPLAARLDPAIPKRFFGWPGFGGVAQDPNVKGLADLAAQVALEVTAPVSVFAQSMGGVIALLATLAKPNHVRRLVLSATSGGIDMSDLRAFDWRQEFRKRNPSVPEWFEKERWNISARLKEIRVPVLLLWGDADPISPVGAGERLAALLPDAELVVLPGGTHDLASDRVDDVLPHVLRHLAKPTPP